MPRNPDEVIRIENEIETLLIGYCRRHDGYRWMRVDNTFSILSPRRKSRIMFTISSYIDNKAFVLNTIHGFFNSSQEPIVGQSAATTILDEYSTVDHIQWVNHQLPWEDRDTLRTPNVVGYGNGKSISPDLITLIRDTINPISDLIGRTLYYDFANRHTVRIQDTGQNPTRVLDMDIHLFSNNVLATRHIYRQLGLTDYNQRGTWIPPAISPIPTRREIELGHRVPRFYPTLQTIPEDMFPITTPSFSSIHIPNAATVPIDSYTTPSTCIEQEEALDINYKDDLF